MATDEPLLLIAFNRPDDLARLIDRLRDVAPSPELRDWYHHQTDRFPQFQTRYAAELAANPAFQELADLARTHPAITLLTASRDVEHSQAVVLQQRLTAALKRAIHGPASRCARILHVEDDADLVHIVAHRLGQGS